MAAPTTTTWPLEEHSKAKHAILRRYLDAWLPILSYGGFKQIVVVDGFAGPGVYDDGSDGSPIVALKSYIAQADKLDATVNFHFIERHRGRSEKLRDTVTALLADAKALPRLRWHIHAGLTFDESYLASVHPSCANRPVFAFIDPFGWTGIDMSTISQILSLQNSEVLINFMFEEINRFLAHPDQGKNFDALFGGPEWKQIVALQGLARHEALRDLYAKKLRERATFVRYFEMRNNRSQTDYFLFFATKSIEGLKKMKAAMWKADPTGTFTFSDATDRSQMVLFGNEPYLPQLQTELLTRFQGQIVSLDEIERFVVGNTAFRETHYKPVLKSLEMTGRVEVVDAKPKRRAGTFAGGLSIRFL
jgi:three-Cys-motif partner protein